MAPIKCTFAYERLDSESAASFRLLSLLPGDYDSPLDCTLSHSQRGSQCQPYEALSYAWGDPTLSGEITLNGRQFPITHNLEQALRRLRSKPDGLPRVLWVDAICIDQAHVPERNNQVVQMGEIYAGAERVLIWLGEASRDSDLALVFMLELHRNFAGMGEISMEKVQSHPYGKLKLSLALKEFLNPRWRDERGAGARILARPWWRRAWVVQELVVAKEAVCYCGQSSIPWSVIGAFIITASYGKEVMSRELSHAFTKTGTLDAAAAICHLRAKFRSGPIHLWKLLKRLYRQRCTDPRDKIYSVLGMTHPRLRESLKPDYDKSVSQVFTEAIAADILDAGDLNALLLVNHGEDPPSEDLPSWVADFKKIFRHESIKFFEPQSRAEISFSPDSRILRTYGFMVDSVIENRLHNTDVGFQRQLPPHQNEWTWDIERITARLVDEGGVHFLKEYNNPQEIHRNVERVVYEVICGGVINSFRGWVQHTVTYPDEEANQIEAAAGTMVYHITQLQPRRWRKVISFWWNRLHNRSGKASLKPRQWRDILAAAVVVTAGRNLILSSKRHLGLAPTATQLGDCIFVLSGLVELAILRPQTDGTYKFIGVSYVHGFMNKEWREDLDRGIFRKQTVSIS